MSDSYDVGDVLRTHGHYTSVDDQPFDPSTVQCSVKAPNGSITTYTYQTDQQLIRSGLGEYYLDVEFTLSGVWYVRHFATGVGKTSEEQRYFVRPSAFIS